MSGLVSKRYWRLSKTCLYISDSSDLLLPNLRSFQNEIQALTEVRHRNIIKLYGYCFKQFSLYLVYEYVDRGSLRKNLYDNEEAIKLNWATRVKIVKGVAHALAYLHHDCSPPIVHRDVSTNNILLDSEFEPRLSDFGTAKMLISDSSNWTTAAGSYGYMAPGIERFELKSIWSCNCCLFLKGPKEQVFQFNQLVGFWSQSR